MEGVFHQLAQCLAVLSTETELMLGSKAPRPTAQALQMCLWPNARQAEVAMHRLRELRLAQTPAGTELSQSLTVLVLAADMLIQGNLCSDSALDAQALLRRNADRALRSLSELRAQFGAGDQPDAEQ